MKKYRVIATLAGVLLFLSIVLTFVWLSPLNKINQSVEIELSDVLSKIDKREVKEINFKQSRVEITDLKGRKYFANVESDLIRESFLTSIKKHNEINTSAPIKYGEEPVSSGFGWIIWLNALPFFVMWAATLAVIVYAVRTLSRNKS